MRFANIAFFIVSAILGSTLSVAFMSQLPFGVFSLDEQTINAIIKLIDKESAAFNGNIFYAKSAMEDLLFWKGIINYVMSLACALIVIAPALATIWVAEGKLFDRRVDRGWKMMSWIVTLGALVVAIYPAPIYIVPYIAVCALLISGYIVTYQWPKAKARRNTNATTVA